MKFEDPGNASEAFGSNLLGQIRRAAAHVGVEKKVDDASFSWPKALRRPRNEDLQQGFKCPQCAAPRRRFARKLGDKIGTTLDGGDTPIIIFTAVCLLIVLGIAYYSLQ